MNRRKIAVGGLAAAAGLAGIGTAWWKIRPHDAVLGPGHDRVLAAPNPNAGTPVDDAVAAFWKSSFDTPEGAPLTMSSFHDKPLLVNFWATWCPPCIEELPLLNSFYQTNKSNGWQLLGLAVDQPSAVRKWLQARPLSFPVGMAGYGGTELSKSLGNLAGSLPFSIVLSASGQLLHRKTGKVTAEELALWVRLK